MSILKDRISISVTIETAIKNAIINLGIYTSTVDINKPHFLRFTLVEHREFIAKVTSNVSGNT